MEKALKENDRPHENGKTAYFGFRQVPESEKALLVRKHFDSISGYYDFMNTLLSFGIHYLWKRTAVRMLELSPGDLVLDVCGGTGDLTILASRVVGKSGRVILYDINRAMIERGRPRSSHHPGRSNISYVQGDAEKISLKERSCDAVMAGFGIRNFLS